MSSISVNQSRRMFGAPALGAISLAAALAVFGGINVAHAGAHPDKTIRCNSSGTCENITNNGNGGALTATATAQNSRALFVYATNSGADGADITGGYIGIIGRAPTSLYPLVLTDSNGNDEFFVDGSGDVYYNGTLNAFLRTRDGRKVASYGATGTKPTIEDTGTAHLVNGQAAVALDHTFALSIDPRVTYQVFLTPGGDTRGLFVATKTPSGFMVRETQNGHSTLSFDYRIIATPMGRINQHMGQSAIAPSPVVH